MSCIRVLEDISQLTMFLFRDVIRCDDVTHPAHQPHQQQDIYDYRRADYGTLVVQLYNTVLLTQCPVHGVRNADSERGIHNIDMHIIHSRR